MGAPEQGVSVPGKIFRNSSRTADRSIAPVTINGVVVVAVVFVAVFWMGAELVSRTRSVRQVWSHHSHQMQSDIASRRVLFEQIRQEPLARLIEAAIRTNDPERLAAIQRDIYGICPILGRREHADGTPAANFRWPMAAIRL